MFLFMQISSQKETVFVVKVIFQKLTTTRRKSQRSSKEPKRNQPIEYEAKGQREITIRVGFLFSFKRSRLLFIIQFLITLFFSCSNKGCDSRQIFRHTNRHSNIHKQLQYGLIFFFQIGLIYHHSRTSKQQRHIHRLKKWY